ncbi:unnamed protein product [Heligmosomoides polygyrus]|uniref:Fibronectin type-III domain-containing protein n=1 Tax=Heligmosomoides polygyrus TaxID=6339 RepID=A0A3P8G6J5_HELPZ|nr:unnamed protein product [Heligmosomoides polygyrus]
MSSASTLKDLVLTYTEYTVTIELVGNRYNPQHKLILQAAAITSKDDWKTQVPIKSGKVKPAQNGIVDKTHRGIRVSLSNAVKSSSVVIKVLFASCILLVVIKVIRRGVARLWCKSHAGDPELFSVAVFMNVPEIFPAPHAKRPRQKSEEGERGER